MITRADTLMRTPSRIGVRHGAAFVITIGIALAVFAVAFAADWRLPGLYMDAVNPEYIIPGIFDPTAPGNRPWILPGNQLLSRFPVFTGTIYHGSAQLYFALPFMALLGADVATLRIVQGVVGGLILLLMALYAGRSSIGFKRALAAAPMALLALDPSFVMALRTQAYSCLFPLVPLLASILLLRDWNEKPRKALRLFASGVLFGLSVFSYFVFAFFLPALVWMLLGERGAARIQERLREIFAWFAGGAVGYLPFLAGVIFLERSLGGLKALAHWLRDHSNHLHVMGASNGVADHLLAVYTDARGVITGKWPWMMVLQHHAGDVTGSLKAGILIALPLLALAFVRRYEPGEKRAIAAPLIFTVSFLACATIFGERLDGHHYTVILPFLYAAFGGACALLWPSPRERMRSNTRAAASIAIVLLLAVAGANAFNLAHFLRDLRASGGAGLYSDAIDRFAAEVQANDPNATVYLPDWGHVMPFMFLTQARVAQIDSIDPRRIARETCEGKPQIVVFNGIDNADKLGVVKQLASQPDPAITVWSQRDGKPVFQSARFPPRTDCGAESAAADVAAAATEAADVPSISVTPATSSDCGFLSPMVATVRWNAGNPALRRAEIWLTPIGGALQPWISGSDRGEGKTGVWALPGMKFVLVDPATMQHLAETEIGKIPCPVR